MDTQSGCVVRRGEVFLDGEKIGKLIKHDDRADKRPAWEARYRGGCVSERRRRRDAVADLLRHHRVNSAVDLREAAYRLILIAPPCADRSKFWAVERLASADNLEQCRAYLYEGAELAGLVPRVRACPPSLPEHLQALWFAADELRLVAPSILLKNRAVYLLERLGPPYDQTGAALGAAAEVVGYMRGSSFWVPSCDDYLESYLAMLCEEIEAEIAILEGGRDAR